MRKTALALTLLSAVCIAACKEAAPEPSPEIETRAQKYLQAQSTGDWKTLCKELAPLELQNIQRALGKPCLEAIRQNKALSRKLQKTSTSIETIEADGENFWVRFESGEIWITPQGIMFTKP